ncbi:MAG: hypothetical protein EHM43_03295 [Ignavibacteriae bacterium]|nr:MAG: hypothetical protein EHM43_12275 [Ignavibacteriota bacterium]RPI68951.1 MAG: hypothetical protein EHM43_03295 [Ignavibacteriota bacterium]
MVLHVTNGDVIAERLSNIGMQGIILPWREILHEGPRAPYKGFDTTQRALVNLVRADFIADQGWGGESAPNILFDMTQRDALLLDRPWDEVVLWFERDLYDQLSLSQVLTLLEGGGRFTEPGVTLVFSDQHLHTLTDDELRNRFDRRMIVDRDLLDHYRAFYQTFSEGRVPQPETSAPTVLHDAAARLQELEPGPDGLSAFDRSIIALVKREGPISVHALLQLVNDALGNDAFWSDLAFVRRLREVALRDPSFILESETVSIV